MKPELGQTAMAKAFFGCQHPLFNAFGIDVVAVADARAEMTMPFPKLLPTAIERCTGAAGDPARHDVRTGHFLRSPLSALRSFRPIASIDLRAVVECIGWKDSVAFVSGRGYAVGEEMPLATVTGSFAIDTLAPAFDTTDRSAA